MLRGTFEREQLRGLEAPKAVELHELATRDSNVLRHLDLDAHVAAALRDGDRLQYCHHFEHGDRLRHGHHVELEHGLEHHVAVAVPDANRLVRVPDRLLPHVARLRMHQVSRWNGQEL